LDGIESSGYHSISQLAASAKRSETAETPNVLGIYLLNCACKKLLNMGVNAIRSDAAERMNALICGIEAQTPLTPLVTNPLHRSPTMAAFIGPEGAPDAIKRLALDHGIFVGGCYNDLKPVGFRVANFPMNTHQEHQALIIRFQEIYG
jgi:phosphoserine aminotransferase